MYQILKFFFKPNIVEEDNIGNFYKKKELKLSRDTNGYEQNEDFYEIELVMQERDEYSSTAMNESRVLVDEDDFYFGDKPEILEIEQFLEVLQDVHHEQTESVSYDYINDKSIKMNF